MKAAIRLFLVSLLALGLGAARSSAASGHRVIVEITFDEQGNAEDGKVVSSDDPSGSRILEQIALNLASEVKQPPRLKEGKPVKFKARAPFDFPIEDDEGPEANNAPKPALRYAEQPVYPEALAAAGTVGGAILELQISAAGTVDSAKVLRASHPEFAQSAQAAVLKWQFAPAEKDGTPVATRWRVAVNFSIEGKEADWKWRIAPRPSLGGFTAARATLPAAPADAAPAEKK